MNPFVLLFDFRGRVGRAQFWLALLIYAVFFVAMIGTTMAATSSMTAVVAAALIVYVPLVISGIAVGIKRLHDRNKSAWWLAVFYLAPLLLNMFAYYVVGDETAMLHQILIYLNFAVTVWALIELGCLRGTIGANEYGFDPRAPAPAPPRALR